MSGTSTISGADAGTTGSGQRVAVARHPRPGERRRGRGHVRSFDRRRCHIVLIGLMGAGKSTVGLLVAERVARPFVDGDSLLGLHHGCTPAELSRMSGTDALHTAELELFEQVMRSRTSIVYAAAASVIDHLDEVEVGPAWVVWLDAPPDLLAARIGGDVDERPLPHDDDQVRATLREQDARRRHLAERYADLRIDVGSLSATEAAERIAEEWTRVSS